jgi:hypothetical protein
MAIVIYQCDTCKRKKEFQRNIRGIETVSRCTITNGCHGKMQQVKILEDFIRESLPDDVNNLENWYPRNLLYNHVQKLTSKTWIITHNLQTFPSAQIFVYRIKDNQEQLFETTPLSITPIDSNTIKVELDNDYKGVAQLVARSTKPPEEKVTVQDTSTDLVTISNKLELTIATLISKFGENTDVDVSIEYTNNENIIPHTYTIDSSPSILSPWVNFNKILYKGKLYLVRSVNIVIPEMTANVIPLTSTMKITSINGGAIVKNDAILLLSDSPYTIYDKIYNKVIECSNTIARPLDLIYNTEVLARNSLIETIYPPIREV